MIIRTIDTRIIADLTGKNHSLICRNIRRQLEVQNIDPVIYQSTFKNTENRTTLCYKLTEEQSLLLMRSYSISMGIKMERWWNGTMKGRRNKK